MPNTRILILPVALVCLMLTAAASAQSLNCPVTQTAVAADAKPDMELFKQILRCKKGEKSVAAGDEGAVTVEVSSLQVGAARPWTYRQDSGSGQEGTQVHPAVV